MVPHQNAFVLDHELQNNQNCESFDGVVPHTHISTIFYFLLYEHHTPNVSMLMPAMGVRLKLFFHLHHSRPWHPPLKAYLSILAN